MGYTFWTVHYPAAYSPGVAAPCEEIAADPSTAALYTARANVVAGRKDQRRHSTHPTDS